MSRYKQYLARAVKKELNLESTPTTDMGESAEESPEEVNHEVVSKQPTPVSNAPAILTSEPPKPQPKGNLVVNPTMLREPSVTTVLILSVCEVAFVIYQRTRREIGSDSEWWCSEEEGYYTQRLRWQETGCCNDCGTNG